MTKTFGSQRALPGDTRIERKRGIFSLKDVANECSADASNGDEPLTPEKLVALLQHLRIITPLKKRPKPAEEEEVPQRYFMPCVMYHSEEATRSEAPRGTQKVPGTPALLFTFDCGYIPKGVFGAVITHLEAECSDWRLKTKYTDDKEWIAESCKVVYSSVQNAIREVAHTLRYIRNKEPIEPIPAFYCCDKEYSNTTPHFAIREIVRNRTFFHCVQKSCDITMTSSQIEGCEQWLAGDGAGLPQIG